jgi:hypothetical protein
VDKGCITPSPLAGRPSLRCYRVDNHSVNHSVHKEFESPATEAIAYGTPPTLRKSREGRGTRPLQISASHGPGCRLLYPARQPAMADQEQTRPHNGRKHRSFSRTKTRDQDFACGPSALPLRGITSRVTSFTDARKWLRLSKNAGSCCLGSRSRST